MLRSDPIEPNRPSAPIRSHRAKTGRAAIGKSGKGSSDLFHSRLWLIPNIAVVYCLLASALILPVMAAVCIVGSQLKHPVILIFTHMVMGASQVFFGLLPLFS